MSPRLIASLLLVLTALGTAHAASEEGGDPQLPDDPLSEPLPPAGQDFIDVVNSEPHQQLGHAQQLHGRLWTEARPR